MNPALQALVEYHQDKLPFFRLISFPDQLFYIKNIYFFQIWSPADRQSLLSSLARLLPQPGCTVDIVRAFRPLALDIVHRAEHGLSRTQRTHIEHQRFCVALSKVVGIHTDVLRFVSFYNIHEYTIKKN